MTFTQRKSVPSSLVTAVPAEVQAWYFLCRGTEIQQGRIVSREFLGRSIVLFRDSSGSVHALAAHCAHMGAHLSGGALVGDHIQCSLHHWEYDGTGICRRIPDATAIP